MQSMINPEASKKSEGHRVIAVVGLPALPGTVNYGGQPMGNIAAAAVKEALLLQKAGVHGIILQNIGDIPALEKVGHETVACMAAAGYAIRQATGSLQLGISVLRNDGAAAVAVAKACDADFIRAKVYTGAMVSAGGIETACMNEVLAMRHKLGSAVQIWADIQSRTGAALGGLSLLQECAFAADKGLCDAFILSGQTLDEALDAIREVKERFPHKPVVLGGGATPEKLGDIAACADVTIVGTYIKQHGNIASPTDPVRLAKFMQGLGGI